MPAKKRKRNETTATPAAPATTTLPTIVSDLDLQPVPQLSFDKDTIKSNTQIWLIKAPLSFDPQVLDGVKLKIKGEGLIKTIINEVNGTSVEYKMINKGSGESIQQVVGFVPSGENAGVMMCTLPFSREIDITETFVQPQTEQNKKTFRGIKHQAYQNVPQIKTMGYRLKPAGYSNDAGVAGVVEAPAKKRKTSKHKKKKKKE